MNPSRVLIDTSVWILSLARAPSPAAARRVRQVLEESRAATMPAIVLELLGGVRTKEEFDRLKTRLDALHQIPLAKAEWEEATQLAFRLRRTGKTIPHLDILIATAAMRSGATLLHADQHYAMIAAEVPLLHESLLPLAGRE